MKEVYWLTKEQLIQIELESGAHTMILDPLLNFHSILF